MFESDQHDFDDEYEELSHSAPPPPVAKQPENASIPNTGPTATPSFISQQPAASNVTAKPMVATGSTTGSFAVSTAVAEPIVEDEEDDEDAEELEPIADELLDFTDAAEQQAPAIPPKKNLNFLLIGGSVFLVMFAIFVVYSATRPKDNALQPGDMGPGIVAVSGLRGHLNTRWEGSAKTGRLVYQLLIEPMEDRWQAGFSRTVLKAPLPIYVNVRLLDATGFALCGKQIDFPFDPQNGYMPAVAAPMVDSNGKRLSAAERDAVLQTARQSQIAQLQAAEASRERGKDIFQNQLTNEGEVSSVNVQGTLPCAPDQFKQASYWDFNTNFPTLDEQADLLNPKASERAKEAAGRSSKRPNFRPQEGYMIQGDDRVTEYDAANGLLWARGRTFQIDRHSGQVTATVWANNSTLIHYRCDQQANCALTAAGGTAVLHARLSN